MSDKNPAPFALQIITAMGMIEALKQIPGGRIVLTREVVEQSKGYDVKMRSRGDGTVTFELMRLDMPTHEAPARAQ